MILRLAILAATCSALALPALAEDGTDLDVLRRLVASVDLADVAATTLAYGKPWELKLLAIEASVRERAEGIDGTVTGSIPQSE